VLLLCVAVVRVVVVLRCCVTTMSTSYVTEPPTRGKVVLNTSEGPLDIELWPKEAPKACRNFVQLCLEGYYDNTIFHRIIKDFMFQGGDPTGTGDGGESIYGQEFADEFHSRLHFNHRGIVAMANDGRNSNRSQVPPTTYCPHVDSVVMIATTAIAIYFQSMLAFWYHATSDWSLTLSVIGWCGDSSSLHSDQPSTWNARTRSLVKSLATRCTTSFASTKPMSMTMIGMTVLHAVCKSATTVLTHWRCTRPIHPPVIKSVEVLWNPFDDIVPREKVVVQVEEPVKKPKRPKVKYVPAYEHARPRLLAADRLWRRCWSWQ
jgi:cyclophilin family peptidyl-prolyl cis-trans isomerase